MKERIQKIMQKEAMNAGLFAEKIGISAASLSHILSGRNNPSLDVMMKIRKAFGYVSWEWLLEGVGEMEYAPTSADSVNPELLDPLSFDENALFAPDGTDDLKNRKEFGVKTSAFATKEVVHEQVKYIEIPSKKITEIRIFFDNGTYETFRPEK